MQIIDYFLWNKQSEYAISNHYDRHCVWDEVLQNKRLNKYNHTRIDEQFTFYQYDGLIKFNESDENTPLPSCRFPHVSNKLALLFLCFVQFNVLFFSYT